MQHDTAKKTMESKNLSDYDLTRDEINLLSMGAQLYSYSWDKWKSRMKSSLKGFRSFCKANAPTVYLPR